MSLSVEIAMQSLHEKEKELRDLRRRCGWYGMRRDFAMQRQLATECYQLYLEIENSKRNDASMRKRPPSGTHRRPSRLINIPFTKPD